MPEPLKPKTTRVTQDTTLDLAGQPVRAVRVTYMVGVHGPFELVMPADQFTADAALAAMQKVADEISKLPS